MNQTAINYGQVLLELAVPREDIESSRQIWESSLPLRQALTNPVIQNKQKNKVIDKIFPSSMHSFMKIVCKYQEESLLSEFFRHTTNWNMKAGVFSVAHYTVSKNLTKASWNR